MQRQGTIRRHDSKLSALSRLIDSSIILLTFLALIDVFQTELTVIYVWGLLFSILLFNFFAESQDAYRSWRGTNIRDEIETVLYSWVVGVLILILIDTFWLHHQVFSEPFVAVWIVLTPIELVSWHAVVRAVLAIVRTKGLNTRKVAIIGCTSLGEKLEHSFNQMEWSGYRLEGYYDDRAVVRKSRDDRTQASKDIEVAGNIEKLISDCQLGKIDAVYITLALSAEHRIKDIVSKLSDTTASVYLVPDLFTFNLLNSRWVDYQGITAVSIFDTPFSGLDSFMKRIEDIVLSSLILCLIAIPMILIALGIKMTSKGPVLFKQARYGMDGEKFSVWKFRSMTVTKNGDKVIQAIKGDSRITSFGKFLRKTSLDELPQFFNSLRGDMSIVGPRPHAVAHNEEYRTQIQGYMLRHKMKPGITGLAQINGFRGETDTLDKMEGRVYYDLIYIQTWSLWLDFKIILLTVFKGFLHKNAY